MMRNNKKLVGAILLSGCFVLFSGCQKEFLDPKPLSYFEPSTTFTSESGLRAALIACDQELRNEIIGGFVNTRSDGVMPMNMRFSELAVGGNTDNGNASAWCEVNTKLTPTTRLDQSVYCFSDVLGTAVKSANTILDYVDQVQGLSDALKNEYKGRAYFHRAYRYYNMIFQYKNVPLITHVISSPKLDYMSTSRDAIIDKMIEDLEFAVANVPDQSKMDYTGMVNKGACKVLLVKFYLADGQFQKAKDLCDDIINNGGYKLMTEPFGTFDEGGEPKTWVITRNIIWDLHRPENKLISENNEVIYGIVSQGSGSSALAVRLMRSMLPFWASGTNQTVIGGVTACTNYARSNTSAYDVNNDFVRAVGRGIANVRPTWYIENDVWKVNGVMDKGDLRHNSEVGNFFPRDAFRYNTKEIKNHVNPEVQAYYGKSYAEAGFPAYSDTIKSRFGFPHYKTFLRNPVNEANVNQTSFEGSGPGGCTNWYVYRLAEVYLLRAEAKYYLGDGTAVDDVNIIRKRAHCEQLYSTVTIGEIMDERARELFLEELRHIELSRVSLSLAISGKPDEWGNTYDVNTYDKQEGTDPTGGSYWWQRICHYNNFYNRDGNGAHKLARLTIYYNINKHNLYLPVPQSAIDANSGCALWQNFGYDGYNENTQIWQTWQEAVEDEEK